MEFMRAQNVILSFKDSALIFGQPRGTIPFLKHDTVYLPAKTKTLVQVTVQNPARRTGYVSRINAGPVVFIGECLVTNNNKKANLFVINSTTEDLRVIIPPVILECYGGTVKPVRSIKIADGTDTEAEHRTRVKKITELLILEGLNQPEIDSVMKLVSQFPCQFHLPSLAKPLRSLTKYRPRIISPLM